MRRLLWTLVAVAALALAGAAAAIVLALEDTPLVRNPTNITPESIGRAKRILERNDPRRLRTGDVRTVSLSARDADLALNQLVHRATGGSSRLALQQGTAHLALSVELPWSPVGRFVNVDATLDEAGKLPRVGYLRIGRLPIPGPLADRLMAGAVAAASPEGEIRLITDMVQELHFGPDRLALVYRWQERAPERLRAAAVSPEDQARLRAYRARLAEWSRRVPGESVSVVHLLTELFDLAAERSARGDAVEENRAAIATATLYAVQQDIAALIPEAKFWPQPAPRRIVLSGRDDTPLHFLVSAMLAAHAGKSLSDAVGLYKELEDARVGSGFSFNDIAADGAGTRFGELATDSARTAHSLQQRMAGGIVESDVMPKSDDLPEFMPEAEFVRRFGGVGGREYGRLMGVIEERIDALPINR